MRIWLDILTPKQVNFFKPAVEKLRRAGHKVLCTSRDYREAVELARIRRFKLEIVGSHGGADRYSKLRKSASRIYELAEVIDRFHPDIAVSFSSPECARVAYGLGIRHIAFNDSPHSEAVAKLALPLSTRLFSPWIIPISAWTGFGIKKSAIVKYHALDPAAWLKNEERTEDGEGSKVLIRLEESKASYIADKGLGTTKFVDRFIDKFHGSSEILVLCRYQDQIEQVAARYGSKVKVLPDVVDGTSLLRSVRLFIGAGGTMTAEAALLGRPTISITPFTYYVEKYLVKEGLVRKATTPAELMRLSEKLMTDKRHGQELRRRARRILHRMEDPTDRLVRAVNSVRL